jgi:hypothetical protein
LFSRIGCDSKAILNRLRYWLNYLCSIDALGRARPMSAPAMDVDWCCLGSLGALVAVKQLGLRLSFLPFFWCKSENHPSFL